MRLIIISWEIGFVLNVFYKASSEIEAYTLLTAYSLAFRGLLGGKIKEEGTGIGTKWPYILVLSTLFLAF